MRWLIVAAVLLASLASGTLIRTTIGHSGQYVHSGIAQPIPPSATGYPPPPAPPSATGYPAP